MSTDPSAFSAPPAVVLSNLSFTWPSGAELLTRINVAFTAGSTGLVGANGSGKSTLLRLIAGRLTPTSGSVSVRGTVASAPQDLGLRSADTVGDLLGVRSRIDAVRAVENGSCDPSLFDLIADDWDVERRAEGALAEAGLDGLDVDRPVGTVSGGEAVRVGLAGLRMTDHRITLLDEPTNSLDRYSRSAVYEAIRTWSGTLIVVSHDVRLLDSMDRTADLHDGTLSTFGGGWSDYRAQLADGQHAAERALRSAEETLKVERRQRAVAEVALARRQRYARTDFDIKRRPKSIMQTRRMQAQVSAGKLRRRLDSRVDAARSAVDDRADSVRRDDRIRVDLPSPGVPAGRRLAEFTSCRGETFELWGAERVGVIGPNGVGKTTLISMLADGSPHGRAMRSTAVMARAHTDRIGCVPQLRDLRADAESVLDVVSATSPNASPDRIRARLARFLLRGDAVHQAVGSLSGGERLRVLLATVLLSDPPNQLLLLDEPTNDLDSSSVDALVDALTGYGGGLVVATHDDALLKRLAVGTVLELDGDGFRVRRVRD
ncbi:ABC-F family ATP-binding cassette domain-containing protein [Gordonia neofelifaecis]|uniref:ABC transporter related protein n=1 Tax=Gordonia neofelifaecis NRRL B-59395 TaxID=644548 RepID=F1YNK3_9ACTN|nr:ATP-binding cassette domain-containing protein [Gordonia neofelifaecis]EGD53740.1 ABC transporter related protein [Gordonia neofelifaecis NRRL B-59395]